MDKKKILREASTDDLKGFEEFLELSTISPAIDKNSKNLGGESLSFLQNDNGRLKRIAVFVSEKLPVLKNHVQGPKIIEYQRNLNQQLKNELHILLTPSDSPLQKSLSQLWDSFFRDGKL